MFLADLPALCFYMLVCVCERELLITDLDLKQMVFDPRLYEPFDVTHMEMYQRETTI